MVEKLWVGGFRRALSKYANDLQKVTKSNVKSDYWI